MFLKMWMQVFSQRNRSAPPQQIFIRKTHIHVIIIPILNFLAINLLRYFLFFQIILDLFFYFMHYNSAPNILSFNVFDNKKKLGRKYHPGDYYEISPPLFVLNHVIILT